MDSPADPTAAATTTTTTPSGYAVAANTIASGAGRAKGGLFRLPAEIRNQIYGYLLDGAQVQTAAGKYAFSLAILRVSKAVHDEAAAVIYGANALVLVEIWMPGFWTMASMMDLPFVANLTREACWKIYKHVSLDVWIDWREAPYLRAFAAANRPKNDAATILILLRDLKKLFDMLRFLCAQTFPHAVVVNSRPGERAELAAMKRRSQLKMTLQTRTGGHPGMYKMLSRAEQEVVLEPLSKLMGAGYLLRLEWFDDRKKADNIRGSVGPSLIWPLAFVKDIVKVCRELLRSIDKMAKDGRLSVALAKYKVLAKFTKTWDLIWEESASVPSLTGAFSIRRNHYCFDLYCAITEMHLRLEDYKEARSSVSVCRIFLPAVTDRMLSWSVHLHSIANLAEFLVDGYMKLRCRALSDYIVALEHLILKDGSLIHDIGVLKNAVQNPTGRIEMGRGIGPEPVVDANSFFERLSFRVLPVRTYDSEAEAEALAPIPRPEDQVGWQDVLHMAELSSEEKDQIHELQRANYMTPTEFPPNPVEATGNLEAQQARTPHSLPTRLLEE